MKKLLAVLLTLGMVTVAFAAEQKIDLDAIKQKAEAVAYSKDSIKSVIEVSFNVETEFSMYDILDKNADHLSSAYMVPGTTPDDTNWNLEQVNPEAVIVYEHSSEYGPMIVINQAHQDKNGNYHEVILNYNTKFKGCSMFLIDENWLIGSIECIGDEDEGAVGYPNYILANTPYTIVNQRPVGNIYFDGKKSNISVKNHVFKGPNVVLVYIGDTPAKDLMADKPKANVYFFRDNIFSLLADGTRRHGSFKVRTSRFGTGAVRSRSLETGSYKDGLFKLDESAMEMSATGGDPLFYQDQYGAQYLVGFNAGKIHPTVPDTGDYLIADYKGEVVNSFFDLQESDYNFVKKTLTKKGDWERVKTHMLLF